MRPKVIDTVLGPVTLKRAWYHCARCRHGLAPRDAEPGVTGTSMSPGLAAMNDLAAAAGPFAAAARRQELAQALWRIVRRDGIDRISVRAVAAEAGTSPGALRHYFATQDELAAFALQAVVDAINGRLTELLPGLGRAAAGVAVLEQYLPLDDQRRGEMAVYLAFLGRPHARGPLAEIRQEAESRSREGILLALAMLAEAGQVHPDHDLAAETDEFYPFSTASACTGHPPARPLPPAHLRRVLRRRLAQLAGPAGRGRLSRPGPRVSRRPRPRPVVASGDLLSL